MKRLKFLLVATALFSAVSTHIAAAEDVSLTAAAAIPLTPQELYRLYSNHTWVWGDGAGYFSTKPLEPQREWEFWAWSGEGESASYGNGYWFLLDQGRLCFRAIWVASAGQAEAVTCFGHRQKEGVIFQRKEPNGEWYVFKNTPPAQGDASEDLRPGDMAMRDVYRVATELRAAD